MLETVQSSAALKHPIPTALEQKWPPHAKHFYVNLSMCRFGKTVEDDSKSLAKKGVVLTVTDQALVALGLQREAAHRERFLHEPIEGKKSAVQSGNDTPQFADVFKIVANLFFDNASCALYEDHLFEALPVRSPWKSIRQNETARLPVKVIAERFGASVGLCERFQKPVAIAICSFGNAGTTFKQPKDAHIPSCDVCGGEAFTVPCPTCRIRFCTGCTRKGWLIGCHCACDTTAWIEEEQGESTDQQRLQSDVGPATIQFEAPQLTWNCGKLSPGSTRP